MGGIAKGSFIAASESYAIQPKAVRDAYPMFVKKTFFTSELLTTNYDDWKIRLVSKKDISGYIHSSPLIARLQYSMDSETFEKEVELIYISESSELLGLQRVYLYEFSFSSSGKTFWQTYNSHLFKFDKPWFLYPISPKVPEHIRPSIMSIQYNYAPNWGYLSLRQFMELFDLNTNERWEEFCSQKVYQYDDSSVCGEIRISDASRS